MELHSGVGDRAVSQLLPPSSLSHTHTHMHIRVLVHTHHQAITHPQTHTNTLSSYRCTDTHELHTVWPHLSLLSLSCSLTFFFSLGFAEIVCSVNVLPPDRKDLNSPPVHTNKGARILLTACRSALPFMTAALKKWLLRIDPSSRLSSWCFLSKTARFSHLSLLVYPEHMPLWSHALWTQSQKLNSDLTGIKKKLGSVSVTSWCHRNVFYGHKRHLHWCHNILYPCQGEW